STGMEQAGMKSRGAAIAILLSLVVLAASSSAFGSDGGGSFGQLGVVRPHTPGATAQTADATSSTARRRRNLRYHGGRILPRSNTFLIFWDPSGGSYPFPPGYEATINTYFDDIAADS